MKRVSRAPLVYAIAHIRKVVQDDQHLVQFLHLQLLGRLGDLALLLDDAAQRRLVQSLPVGLLSFGIHPQVLLYVLLDGNPAVIDGNGRTEDVDSLKHAPVLLQNQADQSHGFAGFAGAEEDAGARNQWHHGVRGLFAAVFRHRKELDLSHPFVSLAKFEAGKPGGESVSVLLHSRTLTEFSGQSGRRVREYVAVYRRADRVFRDKTK